MHNKVIVFDFFGVICSEIAPFWLVKYFSEDEAKQIKATIVQAADIGKLSQQEMFDKLGQIAHIPGEQVEREWWTYVSIDGAVVDMIQRLRVNYPIALLTNSPARFVREILRKHNLTFLFDPIVVSSEEKCAKPDLAIFKRTLERVPLSQEKVLMIDDNPANVQAAIDAGMNGLLFESAPHLKKYLVDRNYMDAK